MKGSKLERGEREERGGLTTGEVGQLINEGSPVVLHNGSLCHDEMREKLDGCCSPASEELEEQNVPIFFKPSSSSSLVPLAKENAACRESLLSFYSHCPQDFEPAHSFHSERSLLWRQGWGGGRERSEGGGGVGVDEGEDWESSRRLDRKATLLYLVL